uniref:Autophagy-related protein 2 n=1 Tax=Kalanchoe fedtschenkoi TaxID=63787 RepID=A0A7N0T1I9_KALFE
MFPWNIAKSAEEMFSRWAMKRVCKFLLKKKLGQFILGEIDLDQLDVQLRAGTIQLFDLALNVDFLNQKLGQAGPVMIKEGSIGSLLVSMPWNGNGFEVEVDELELLLTPCVEHASRTNDETSTSDQGKNCLNHESRKPNRESSEDCMAAAMDIHEGVKTVARMVKWFLTSFHVKVKRLLVAYDPNRDGSNLGICPNLVLRISEIECGTCVSEDADSESGTDGQNILGISCLTNFFSFRGGVVEFLAIDDGSKESASPAVGTPSVEQIIESCASSKTTPVITGEGDGFSGTMKLSIPWKDGSLDTRKVDANMAVDPIMLMIEPSTIKWMVMFWDSFKRMEKDHHLATSSVYYNASSQLFSSVFGSTMTSAGKLSSIEESLSSSRKLSLGKEPTTSCLLPASLIISDWVPSPVNENQTDGRYEGLDFGTSVEQFFECFDGLRSSQTAMASSGILNWTCSVFNAITAASNLASGSYYVPPEQKHIEANVRASLASVSLIFSFNDDNHYKSCDSKEGRINVMACRQYLVVDVQTLLLDLQVCPQDIKLDVTMEHIELTYLTDWKNNKNFGSDDSHCNTKKECHDMQQLQYAVEDALPPTAMLARPDTKKSSRSSSETVGDILDTNCVNRLRFTGLEIDNKLKVQLLRTAGSLHFQVILNTDYEGRSEKPTSFSLRLPPFVFWVNFHVINMVAELLVKIRSENSPSSYVSGEKNEVTDSESTDRLKASHLQVGTQSKEKLLGTIYLIDARIIFCFPPGSNTFPTDCASWNHFVALDFSSSRLASDLRKEMGSAMSLKKGLSSTTSCSLHLNFGNTDIHLVNCEHEEVYGTQDKQALKFCSRKLLSISSKSSRRSAINMIWQEGSLSGPSITQKAKTLAASGMGSGNKIKGKDYEFASVNAVRDPRKREESCSQARNSFILSSSLILHVHLASLVVNLDSDCYKELHRLLNQVKMAVHIPTNTREDSAAQQTSLLVQCDSIEVLVSLDKEENIKKSLQSELPGSWSSLKLNALKFEFFSVLDLGGIRGASFLWVSHSEGKLWGRISETSDLDFLLISCSNSSMKRGDGQGSNTLSTSFAGADIIHLLEPGSSQNLTSVTIKCATIVAAGGRLDWLDAIPSFFSLRAEAELVDLGELQDSKSPKESSFALNLVDIGLSYEPYKNMVAAFGDDFDFVSPCSGNIKDEEPYFSCLLAAASLSLSNTRAIGAIEDAFKIRIQDLGLLLSPVSPPLHVSDPYCADHLRKVGYTKVAGEALLDLIVRTNCKSGLQWEVECFESLISIETCYDTTLGLIRLVSQLQQLFTPDVEESVVHLQTRWDNVQHALETNSLLEERTHCNSESGLSPSMNASNSTKSASDLTGLMDEICENAFQLDAYLDDLPDLQFHLSHEGCFSGDAHHFSQQSPQSMIISERVPGKGLNSQGDSCPDFIEDYCISALQPPTELYPKSQSSKKPRNSSVGVHNGWYQGTSLEIVDDHISESKDNDQLNFGEGSFPCLPAQDTVKPKACIQLKNIDMRWLMYAGSSWYNTENGRSSADVSGRDSSVCLEFALSGIGVQYEIFPDSEVLASKLALSVQDFHLYDSSKDAPWKLVLGYYHSKDHPRVSSSKAIKLNLEAVRPDPATPLEEYRLSIALLPMLVHLHQSQLDFLTSFFGGMGSSVDSDPQGISVSKLAISKSQTFGGHTITEEALLPFFQKFDIWPVLLRVDYTPRGVDLPALGSGKYAELVNIVPWKGIEIQLKHVHAMGIYGWNSVCDRIVGEWLEDVSQNQIHKLLQGLPTIRSLVSVGSGAAKLVSLPLKNYRKDRKLLKGMQRGTIAFLRSISLEAVALGVHLAAGAHDILFQAEYILAGIPPSVSQPAKSKEKDNIRANQPEDAQQGIIQACESFSNSLGEAASTLIGTPLKRYNSGASPGSALASAVCATPAAAIAPAAAAMRAVHCALLGVRNSLDPEHKKESLEKYLGHSPSPERHN